MREKMKTLPIPVTILVAVGVMVGCVYFNRAGKLNRIDSES